MIYLGNMSQKKGFLIWNYGQYLWARRRKLSWYFYKKDNVMPVFLKSQKIYLWLGKRRSESWIQKVV